jgi:hypothetical protein
MRLEGPDHWVVVTVVPVSSRVTVRRVVAAAHVAAVHAETTVNPLTTITQTVFATIG